jgi:hypothetical protein
MLAGVQLLTDLAELGVMAVSMFVPIRTASAHFAFDHNLPILAPFN